MNQTHRDTPPQVTLSSLEDHDAFRARHIGISAADRNHMLAALGLHSLDQLLDEVVPAPIRLGRALDLPAAASEATVTERLRALAGRNQVMRSYIGLGYHDTHTPPVILRNVLENPAWYTAYTPYQPEISQGRLEALLNFQTLIAELTGLPIANASMLDEATAAAEAMTLCRRAAKSRSPVFLVDAQVLPQTLAVLRTRAAPLGILLQINDYRDPGSLPDACGALFQYPGREGAIRSPEALAAQLHAHGGLLVMACDPLALTLLKSPGGLGADVAVGSAQRFGVPMFYGGPHPAFLAVRESMRRDLPGRLVGVSVDCDGRPALRLAMQTREQHIRREKATSNICTAQALLAIIAGLYAVWHGPEGLRRIARRVHRMTCVLAAGLRELGFPALDGDCFDTLVVPCPGASAGLHSRARSRGMNLREIDADTLAITLDETTTGADVEALWTVFAERGPALAVLDRSTLDRLPATLLRSPDDWLTHPVFNTHHAETQMLRYLRRLADRDLALDRTMIPLGSCTMKLNATTEMLPVTWPGFARIHPYAPAEQTAGYRALIDELSAWLAECTGYDAVSLQPNAGSQGEYAGLLAIRAWHASRGEGTRDICLIPSSAHGTNPASAQMAGLQVMVVNCDGDGNIDLGDLEAKARQWSSRLAAIMITYPSTHGVFEEGVRKVAELVHAHGGQVYIDGANFNAQVGLARPGDYGGDVSHLNLHKTFCIPHGGGGPGVGPTAVKAHLAPFLPGNPGTPGAHAPAHAGGAVAGAAFGSAGILPISWAYIALMGPAGLREASAVALLSANYIAHRLAAHYPVLYSGQHGRVAHECILDLRAIKERTGVTVDDVAKRLMDYGFHAPTMSFPVPGTLMIEPTESEPLAEIDRFCEAMIAIRGEIQAVESGALDTLDNPLRNAPHPAERLLGPWPHAYSRELGAYPLAWVRGEKYWPPVGRVDNAYGDRNLVCSCAPIEDYSGAPYGGA
jgi:glycine dehydrogenase